MKSPATLMGDRDDGWFTSLPTSSAARSARRRQASTRCSLRSSLSCTSSMLELIAPSVQRYLTAGADELGLPERYRA